MKKDVVSQTSERIASIINDYVKNDRGIYIRLENIMDECKSPKFNKLKLHITHEGAISSQIVSDCLSLDDTGRIQKAVRNFCEQHDIPMR